MQFNGCDIDPPKPPDSARAEFKHYLGKRQNFYKHLVKIMIRVMCKHEKLIGKQLFHYMIMPLIGGLTRCCCSRPVLVVLELQ